MHEEQEKLDHLRHSAAHLFAAAVTNIWPETKITIGPAIESGFYYDADYGDVKISENDFPRIEQKMHELVKSWTGFERIEVSEAEAKEKYKNNSYKLELIDEIVAKGEPITLYRSGEFVDLCRGGHRGDASHLAAVGTVGTAHGRTADSEFRGICRESQCLCVSVAGGGRIAPGLL